MPPRALDESSIQVGNVQHAAGVAIGQGARAHVNFYRGLIERLIVKPQFTLNLNLNPDLDLSRLPLAPPHPHSLEPELNNLLGRNAELKALLELFQQTCAGEQGGMVWLTSKPGMGCKALGRKLLQLIDSAEIDPDADLELTTLNLVARFWNTANSPGDANRLYTAEPRGQSEREQWAMHIAAAFPHASQVAGPAWVSLMSQLASALELVELPPGLPDDPGSLLTLLRQTLAEHDVGVLLLEDFDWAGPTWDGLIESLARAANHDLKLILILTGRADQPFAAYTPETRPLRLEFAARLVERQLATVFWLGPLAFDDFAASCPDIDPAISRALFSLANGIPLWIEKLWGDWMERDWVEKDRAGCWRATPAFKAVASGHVADYAEFLLRRALDAPRSADRFTFNFDEAAELLRCAALEGQTFTVQAVAAACDFDADDVQDFFDEALCGDNGLLADAGFVEFGLPAADLKKSVYQYRFHPPVAYYAFAHSTTETEQRAFAYRLADALERTYWPLPDRIAPTLARLFELGGLTDPDATESADAEEAERAHHKQAERNSRMARYARLPILEESIEAQIVEIEFLKTWAHDDLSLQRLALAQIALAEQMSNSRPLSEALEIAQDALETTRALKWHEKEAKALYIAGVIMWDMGNYPAARVVLEQGIQAAQACHSESGETICLEWLGRVAWTLSEYAAARGYYERSLAINEKLGRESGIPASLHGLGKVANVLGEYAAGRGYYERSLAIDEKLGREGQTAFSLQGLGEVTYALGEYAAARGYYERSLVISEKLGQEREVAVSLDELGRVANALGEYAAARGYYERSLAIFEKLGLEHLAKPIRAKLEKLSQLSEDAVSDKSKSTPSSKGDINVGNVANSTGVAIGHGAQAAVTQVSGASGDEIAKAFAALTQKVDALAEGANKNDAKDALQKLEAEARQGAQADESRVGRWATFLVEMLPDAKDVVVDMLANPLLGVNTVFKKIAERIKEEKANKK